MPIKAKNYDPALAQGAVLDDVKLGDLGDLFDENGNEILEFDTIASAVNHIGVQNAATGGNPTVYAAGEADTGITFENSENEEILILDSAATSVNEITITSAAAAANPSLAATGDNSFIAVQLTSKGTASVLVGNSSTGTVTSGSALINAQRGVVTTASLTTATAAAHTFDLVNNKIGSASQVFVTITNGTNTGGLPTTGVVDVATTGSATIRIVNADSRPAGTAFNGTLKVNFIVLS